MDRFRGLTVLCFAGTYALALASELARVVVRTSARWYLTLALLAAGWAVHTAFLVNRLAGMPRLSIATQFDFLLVLSWIFAATAVYLIVRVPKAVAVGAFVLPVVVALAALAALEGAAPGRPSWGDWAPSWALVHVGFLTLGAVGTCVAFVAGLMYLVQVRRLKRKVPTGAGWRLPSLEQSERLNRVAVTLAFPLMTFGLLIGLALNWEGAPGRAGRVLRWSDPKILAAGAMWLVYAGLLHARFRPEMQGRRVMLWSIAAFAFLIFAVVGVNYLLPTGHGTALAGGGGPP